MRKNNVQHLSRKWLRIRKWIWSHENYYIKTNKFVLCWSEWENVKIVQQIFVFGCSHSQIKCETKCDQMIKCNKICAIQIAVAFCQKWIKKVNFLLQNLIHFHKFSINNWKIKNGWEWTKWWEYMKINFGFTVVR